MAGTKTRCRDCKYGGVGFETHSRNTLKTFLAFLTLSVIGAVLLASYQPMFGHNLRALGPGFLQSMSSSEAQLSVRSLVSLAEQRLAKRAKS
jgi:hypothetical protein